MVVELRQQQDLEQLLQRSKTDPVVIFKHSTQCPISDHAYHEFTRFEQSAADMTCGLVLVIENRTVSDAIAAQLGVRHESPQALVVKDGKVTWHAAHWSINADTLREALQDHAQSTHP